MPGMGWAPTGWCASVKGPARTAGGAACVDWAVAWGAMRRRARGSVASFTGDGLRGVRHYTRAGRNLIAGDGGVNLHGPGVDAAGDGLSFFEALLTEPVGYGEGAGAVR